MRRELRNAAPAQAARARAVAIAVALVAAGAARAAPPVHALAAGGRDTYARASHVCAAVADGVQCWGAGSSAQLGDALLARRRPLPVRVGGLAGRVDALAAGGAFSCAIRDGRVLCWGDNTRGQAGHARPLIQLAPEAAELPGAASALAAGAEHACALLRGEVWCWGRNEAGETGFPPKRDCRGAHTLRACRTEPRRVEGLPGPAQALALGARFSCARVDGAVWCWGANDRGQLGAGGPASRWQPARVEGLPGPARDLAAGWTHGCALVGEVPWCWGAGGPAPRAVALAELGAVSELAAGGEWSCALSGPQVACWGSDGAVVRHDFDRPATTLAVGADCRCAGLDDGTVQCWGENDFGQLGRGRVSPGREGPAPVAAWDDGRLRDRNGDGRLRVVCLGDSNTQRTPGGPPTWCEHLGELLPEPFEVVNRGIGGATAISGSLIQAHAPLAYALENDEPDAVILAFGSNDLIAGAEVDAIVEAYRAHVLRAYEEGVTAYVALTPPVTPRHKKGNRRVRELNEALVEAFPPALRIDFSDAAPEDLVDDVHLGPSGQRKRARAAAEVLRRDAGVGEP